MVRSSSQMPCSGGRSVLPCAMAVGLLVPGALAENVRHDYRLTSEAEYDSNPAFVPDDLAEHVWRGVVTPGYQLKWKEGKQEVEVDATLRVQRSSDERLSFNREDPSASVVWRTLGPRSEFSVDARYREASTRITEFEDSGVLLRDGTREEADAGVAWEYRLSERLLLSSQGRYSDVAFEEANLIGFESLTAGLTLGYRVSSRLQPYLQAGYTRQSTETAPGLNQRPDSELAFAGAGLSVQLSRRLEFDASASATRIEIDTASTPTLPAAAERPLLDGEAWNGQAALSYAGERGDVSLSASRTTAPGGVGGFIEADTVGARASYQLGEFTRAGLSASLRTNDGPIGNELRSAGIWAERRLAPAWRLRAEATYREREGRLTASGTLVNLSLVYERPRP